MWEDHRSREGYCDVCGDPLDPFNLYSDYPQPLTVRSTVTVDNLKFGKCKHCRTFVPDIVGSVNKFWKEFYS